MSSGIVIRPSSSATRSCASAPHAQSWTSRGSVPVRRASSSAVSPLAPGVAQPLEQAQLEADVDVPRAVEPAEARDEVIEAVVDAHWRGLWHATPAGIGDGWASAAARPGALRSGADATARGPGGFGHRDGRHRAHRSASRATSTARSSTSSRPTWTAATRSPCA